MSRSQNATGLDSVLRAMMAHDYQIQVYIVSEHGARKLSYVFILQRTIAIQPPLLKMIMPHPHARPGLQYWGSGRAVVIDERPRAESRFNYSVLSYSTHSVYTI